MTRGHDGRLRLAGSSVNEIVHFTLDGSEPTARADRYVAPITLNEGGLVRATCFDAARRLRWSFDRAAAGGADAAIVFARLGVLVR